MKLIEQLIDTALHEQDPLALLRMAMVVAQLLDVHPFTEWIANEQNGYSESKIPSYRFLKGDIAVRYPEAGSWQCHKS